MKSTIMKKLTAFTLSAVMALSASYSAFATTASDNTNTTQITEDTIYGISYSKYPVTRLPESEKVSMDIVNQVREDYLKTLPENDYTIDDVHFDYYGTMSNGDMLVYTEIKGTMHTTAIEYINLGDYMYVLSAGGTDVKIYRDNQFYTIKEIFEDENTTFYYKMGVAFDLHLMSIYKGGSTKSDLEGWIKYEYSIPGARYSTETREALEKAKDKILSVIDDPDATQAEIDDAYFQGCVAIYCGEEPDVYDDRFYVSYYYSEYVLENKNSFTEESTQNLRNYNFDCYMQVLFGHEREEVIEATDNLEKVLLGLEPIEDNPDMVSYTEALKINEIVRAYKEEVDDYYELVYGYLPEFKDFNGYRLVSGRFDYYERNEKSERIDKYIFEVDNLVTPSEYGYFAVNAQTGDILTLEEAIEKGIVELDKLFELKKEGNFGLGMYLLGDVNYDGEVNVIDATTIQKVGIGLAQQDNKNLETDSVYDFNYDGRVSILDTTEVQKHIAKIK